ncbi:hypothetical protein FRC14_006395 [Serendipita sp. 396]|nr:hypothetical protein FRC14_006395 [Serendipita sp. 396]KAG8802417.1 hypothetical protein FRC16_009696 [Serendipita sp. 398]KAG8822240.1 hypothetical protein FRC18_011072 [Serendipita sp. 400]KAG8858069.1 hypothetical protein FRB91_010458 [Serendipita sp. 411]KAG8871637.1 hypothetical protein FRC20_010357 [Serendipita sp. 405]
MPPKLPPPVHVIVKLPYNRPEGAVDPPVVLWTAEKEAMLWDIISRYRGSESAGIDWPGLSNHLKVPLPFLMYRAQVRYEEDLRGLQGNVGASVISTPTRPVSIARATDKVMGSPVLRTIPLGLRSTQMSPPSRQSTPIAIPRSRLPNPHRSPHGPQGSPVPQRPSLLSASTVTLNAKTSSGIPTSGSPLTLRRPPSPFTAQSSSSDSSENENEEELEKQENQEEVGKRLKELERLVSSQLLGFARPKSDPAKARQRLTLSIIKDTRPPEPSGDRLSTTSSSIPSIPSPPPEQLPGTPKSARAATMGTRATRSPPQSPPHQIVRNKMLGKPPTRDRNSNQGSSASSFSDISDASISTSALEDALTSNFKQGSTSRLVSFTRSAVKPGP